jgi:hypothetical protein
VYVCNTLQYVYVCNILQYVYVCNILQYVYACNILQYVYACNILHCMHACNTAVYVLWLEGHTLPKLAEDLLERLPDTRVRLLSLSLSLSIHPSIHLSKNSWVFPSQLIKQPRSYSHTSRAPPGVSLPSRSRARNLRILDPAYKPFTLLGV